MIKFKFLAQFPVDHFANAVLLFYSLRVFHISVSLWFLTEVWVTISVLESPGLFSVFELLNSLIVWMVSPLSFIFKSSSPCTNPLVTVSRAPITIGIKDTFMFHNFSIPLQGPGIYPSFNFLSVLLCWDSKTHNFASSLFLLLIIIRSDCLAEIWWSVCISKSHGSLCVSFSKTAGGLCMYHLFLWSNLNFLHNSQWIT